MVDEDQLPLLTRGDAVALVRKLTGLPLTVSRLEKDCAAGVGPAPIAHYGKRLLYGRRDVLQWAEGLILPIRADLAQAPGQETPANWHAAKPARQPVSEGSPATPEKVTS